jgi:hypothetical protein
MTGFAWHNPGFKKKKRERERHDAQVTKLNGLASMQRAYISWRKNLRP